MQHDRKALEERQALLAERIAVDVDEETGERDLLLDGRRVARLVHDPEEHVWQVLYRHGGEWVSSNNVLAGEAEHTDEADLHGVGEAAWLIAYGDLSIEDAR